MVWIGAWHVLILPPRSLARRGWGASLRSRRECAEAGELAQFLRLRRRARSDAPYHPAIAAVSRGTR
jgi:hypothetical protein